MAPPTQTSKLVTKLHRFLLQSFHLLLSVYRSYGSRNEFRKSIELAEYNLNGPDKSVGYLPRLEVVTSRRHTPDTDAPTD